MINNITMEFKIEIPEGHEIDQEKSTFERIVFRPINKKPQWEDFGDISGYYILTGYCDIVEYEEGGAKHGNKDVWPTKEEAKAALALSQLCQWRDKYNDGWSPDWDDSFEMKYCILYRYGKVCTDVYNMASRVLSFKRIETVDKFLEDFRELIEIAKPLL